MRDFAEYQSAELKNARARNPRFASLHEGFAVLLEEVDELWDQVRMRPMNREDTAIRMECVQIAAMAQRIYEECTR